MIMIFDEMPWIGRLCLIVLTAFFAFSLSADSSVVHEDAEDGDTAGWSVYDSRPPGSILNVADPANPANRVVELRGSGTKTGCKFAFSVSPLFKLQWRMRFSEPFIIYVKCRTNRGVVYLYYTPAERDRLGRGRYIHHGLGAASADGEWTTVRRDLQKDLRDAGRNRRLISVEAFYVRGSGMIDDIVSMDYPDDDHDLISNDAESSVGLNPADPSDAHDDLDEDLISNLDEFILGTKLDEADTDSDGLSDYFEVFVSCTNPLTRDSDSDGVGDELEDPDADTLNNLAEQTAWMNPLLKATKDPVYDYYLLERTVREDAESGDTGRWSVFGGRKNRKIAVVPDPRDSNGKVVRIRKGVLTPCFLPFEKPERVQFKISWDMKYRRNYVMMVVCRTTLGRRFLYYTASKRSWLGNGRYIHHGLGKNTRRNNWTTIHRDLQKDIWDARDDCRLISVEAFVAMGKGLLDNIATSAYADSDRDLIPNSIETAAGLDKDDSEDAEGDIDSDGIDNLTEFFAGTLEISHIKDEDGDGLDDDWEMRYFGNLDHGAAEDFDGDGLTNIQEMTAATDPTKKDTDGDGMSDKDEIDAGRDPNNPDEDTDGLPDGWEMRYFGNLNQGPNDDPDNDQVDNITEYKYGRHPNAGAKRDSDNKMKLKLSLPLK